MMDYINHDDDWIADHFHFTLEIRYFRIKIYCRYMDSS